VPVSCDHLNQMQTLVWMLWCAADIGLRLFAVLSTAAAVEVGTVAAIHGHDSGCGSCGCCEDRSCVFFPASANNSNQLTYPQLNA